MEKDLDFEHEPDLGYIFYPPDNPEHPGHPRLDVIIPEQPTYRHFDPQKVHFHVAHKTLGIVQLTVHHPWTLNKTYRVCGGRVTIVDRDDKRVEAFSLGGDLEIKTDAERTICTLVSPAPIFPLFTTHDLSMWITDEIEILLAQRRAQWDPQHPHSFEMHLATVDPLTLYASCLQALHEKFAGITLTPGSLEYRGQHFVDAEIERLQKSNKWPTMPQPLEELL